MSTRKLTSSKPPSGRSRGDGATHWIRASYTRSTDACSTAFGAGLDARDARTRTWARLGSRFRHGCTRCSTMFAPRSSTMRIRLSSYHHRLVSVHVFPNGNGRHARLMADLLLTELEGRRFEWGRGSLVAAGDVRTRYIAALRTADTGDYRELLQFLNPAP